MNRRFRQLFFLSVAVLSAWLARASASVNSISLDEYRRQLGDLAHRVHSLHEHPEQAASIEASIPDTVAVSTPTGEIKVNYRDLKSDLSMFLKADAHRRETLSSQVENYIRALASQARSYAENADDPAQARSRLESILGRREFRKARSEPGIVEILRAKITNWLLSLFSRFDRASRFDWFQVAIYTVAGAALVMLLTWTARRLRRRAQEEAAREIIPFLPSSRSSSAWLAEARLLAQREDWRSAIHLAYWAGISFLEERGLWRPNRARTPREYLRLLTTRNPLYPSLVSLTRKFEITWYGRREAGPADFQETLGQLERLGCR